jgi:hypothetical protein
VTIVWQLWLFENISTDERVAGRTDRRERFFVELLAFDRGVAAISYEVISVCLLGVDFSSPTLLG